MFQKKLEKPEKAVQCKICPNNCIIPEGKYGICGIRKNISGKIKLTTYGIISSISIDPIEKKPLYQFYPHTKVFSIGGYGCNFKCGWCQNYGISTEKFENIGFRTEKKITPEKIIQKCKQTKIKIIAFTYNEPTIWYEYIYNISKLAKKQGIKTIMVTNGYINPEPLKKLIKNIDAANVDLKGFSADFYKKNCAGKLQNVLNALKIYKQKWLEITTLLIPKMNDSEQEINKMSKWISENLGKDTPLHFSRFYPMHKLSNIESTPKETLIKAKQIAEKHLDYVYVGNIQDTELNSTKCPKCKKIIIERTAYNINDKTKKGKCPYCKYKIAGKF